MRPAFFGQEPHFTPLCFLCLQGVWIFREANLLETSLEVLQEQMGSINPRLANSRLVGTAFKVPNLNLGFIQGKYGSKWIICQYLK